MKRCMTVYAKGDRPSRILIGSRRSGPRRARPSDELAWRGVRRGPRVDANGSYKRKDAHTGSVVSLEDVG